VRNPSMVEEGVVASSKAFMLRAARRAGLVAKSAPRKPYRTSYVLDPESNLGVRRLPEPVLTEFAQGPRSASASKAA
jgi:hypothetical protein